MKQLQNLNFIGSLQFINTVVKHVQKEIESFHVLIEHNLKNRMTFTLK